jgi:hypothetical protein
MHKDTLANIVIKAVRQANSVIDSSYEFPEVGIRTNEEIAFRDNVLKYCNACHDNNKEEQRAAYTQNILEYAAALQVNEDYGKKLPELIKSIKRCKISTWAGIGLSYAGIIASSSTSVIAVSIFGVLSGFKNQAYDLIWKRIHGQPLEKKLIDEYYEHSLQEDFAKELKQATQKEFNDAIFEHWDELTTALEDVSEKETKRLLGKKSWE